MTVIVTVAVLAIIERRQSDYAAVSPSAVVTPSNTSALVNPAAAVLSHAETKNVISPVRGSGAEAPSEIRRQLEHFGDTAVPVAQRLRELDQLGVKGDAESVSVLKAVGDAETYLNYAAIEALGHVRDSGVTEYLVAKLGDPDSRMVCAAVKSLAALEGAKAVPGIGVTLKANRSRPDGHQDLVCGTCVEALGAIGVPAAIPLLGAELKETRGVSLSYAYGSQVVAALKKIGDPAGRPVLLGYAAQLAVEANNKPPDPMVQAYMQGLIREAQDAAETLGH